MPPNRFESEVESFLEGSHGDRTHIKRADHPRLHHYAGRYWEFFTLRRCGRRVGAKKFAPQAQNGQNMLFSGALGECFRGNAAGGPCWASYFACQQSWDPGRVLMQRGPGRWALVAVLTLQCAAEAT